LTENDFKIEKRKRLIRCGQLLTICTFTDGRGKDKNWLGLNMDKNGPVWVTSKTLTQQEKYEREGPSRGHRGGTGEETEKGGCTDLRGVVNDLKRWTGGSLGKIRGWITDRGGLP